MSLPNLEIIDTREEDHDNVMAPDTLRAAEAPAFAQHPPRPVSLHCTRIRTNRYEDDAIEPQAVRDNMYTHAPAAELPAIFEDAVDVRPGSNSFPLGERKNGDGDASASSIQA